MSEDDHIVKSFDDDLVNLKKQVCEMGELALQQYMDAVVCLKKWDNTLYEKVMASDNDVNAWQEKIVDRATSILALRQPVAVDLRQVLSALKIANDLERIGDCAQNIVKRANRLTKDLFSEGGLMAGEKDAMYGLMQQADLQLRGTLESYTEHDADKAIKMWMSDDKLDDFYALAVRKVVRSMSASESGDYKSFSHLLLLLKDIERIGDHSTNIAECVHYLVHGSNLKESLPSWALDD